MGIVLCIGKDCIFLEDKYIRRLNRKRTEFWELITLIKTEFGQINKEITKIENYGFWNKEIKW